MTEQGEQGLKYLASPGDRQMSYFAYDVRDPSLFMTGAGGGGQITFFYKKF